MISRILVCGSRHFSDYNKLENVLTRVLIKHCLSNSDVEIVSGHCSGADALSERFARSQNIKLSLFPADWNKYGRSAGPIRNQQMINYIKQGCQPIVVAFISADSKGTKNTILLAKQNNIQVYAIVI